MDLQQVARIFGIEATPEQLPGGSNPTFRLGDVVLKRVKETSLENNHSPQLMEWIVQWSNEILEEGYRFPKAIKTIDGKWITENGWTAWTIVNGNHARKEDIPQIITGIIAFHKALKNIPKNPLMDDNQTAWGRADKHCWEEKPIEVDKKIKVFIEKLYSLRKPVAGLENQLIHGDLNPENILIAPNLHPAFIDFSPFWRPVEFSLGMFANWIGPRQGDISVVEHFQHIRDFDQMLLRASIRMLLVMGNFDDWESSSEKKAAELVVNYMESKNQRKLFS